MFPIERPDVRHGSGPTVDIGPLPAEAYSQQRARLNVVEAILSMRTGLPEIHREGAITDHRMQGRL
jgi:hypothetical protein